MKSAIVTGTSSGIGNSIAIKLLKLGYRVYGLSRTDSENLAANSDFSFIECDLRNSKDIKSKIESLLKTEKSIHLLIHNAGFGLIGMHEELNYKNLEELIQVNLTAPILITRLLLRELKANQGTIINISSITAKKNSPLASAYAATKAGLTQFGNSIFEEVRKYNVKVCNIHPDVTKTNFYKNLSVEEEEEDKDSYLLPETIADCVEMILNQNQGTTITDITLQPQKHKIKRKKNTLVT
ncbi:MAG TPA: SDR family NAD(P)-dependent oxidoreductase [Leptospiraceae bacterium]|nr:SDR family NAD(P)-dependent oxidoreductase [Leptospiraceae bacterium]HMW04517.1 SDR family NAD(P)-dependent oxidoreductase [Leptospiraceae bacterium]HMX31175.1 SDR family NAD(P)-dependent oxidoreductase [Leptospiraceae bacterium]HMY30703.1 SDR family NAD(P)-dependent oxidoreductase [Leptospiraceae bacterium]HMZ63228.1 SDR family NAD(P)-dependent oxidoreductase [Leptospiraceae bacterium]